MADWNQIKKNLGTAAEKAKKKTGELVDDASMQMKLKRLEAKRNALYEQLGRLTYRQLKTGESQAEKIADTIEGLDDVRAKHRAQAELIAKTKRERAEQKIACEAEAE
ncbi:MAG: hypothetical protein J6Q82_07030 [Clostridia bacterium]|nr:hypothetical protein [Clostridia bacterium]